MRHWLTPRWILIALLLVVAPGAAVGHLLLTWAPGKLAVMGLSRAIVRDARKLDLTWKQSERLREQMHQLEESVASADDNAGPQWLPQRDREGVFDRLAGAFHEPGVSIERMTLDEPVLFTAVSRANLLASECVAVECTGDYAALTRCLDRVLALELPVRFKHLSWGHGQSGLRLAAQIQVPFVPDAPLATFLADRAGLEKEVEESDEL